MKTLKTIGAGGGKGLACETRQLYGMHRFDET